MANYRNLIAWQKSHALALKIYKVSEKFPRYEIFGITSQIRRAALSTPANIVEDYNRKSKKEFSHFIDIALGSLAETEYLSEFAAELNYMSINNLKDINCLTAEAGKVLWGLKQSKLKP